jgi:hypothetical protein
MKTAAEAPMSSPILKISHEGVPYRTEPLVADALHLHLICRGSSGEAAPVRRAPFQPDGSRVGQVSYGLNI